VNADPDSDVLPSLRIRLQRTLDVGPEQHGVARRCERDHEPVPLGLDDVPAVVGDVGVHQIVVAFEQLDPGPVAQRGVEPGRALDVGEDEDHVSAGREPREVRPLDLGPVRELVDRVLHGPEAAVEHRVRGLEDRLHRHRTHPAPALTAAALAACTLQLASRGRKLSARGDEQCDERDEPG
jgi:hypothetical protein